MEQYLIVPLKKGNYTHQVVRVEDDGTHTVLARCENLFQAQKHFNAYTALFKGLGDHYVSSNEKRERTRSFHSQVVEETQEVPTNRQDSEDC